MNVQARGNVQVMNVLDGGEGANIAAYEISDGFLEGLPGTMFDWRKDSDLQRRSWFLKFSRSMGQFLFPAPSVDIGPKLIFSRSRSTAATIETTNVRLVSELCPA
jgi:hypothetical protein